MIRNRDQKLFFFFATHEILSMNESTVSKFNYSDSFILTKHSNEYEYNVDIKFITFEIRLIHKFRKIHQCSSGENYFRLFTYRTWTSTMFVKECKNALLFVSFQWSRFSFWNVFFCISIVHPNKNLINMWSPQNIHKSFHNILPDQIFHYGKHSQLFLGIFKWNISIFGYCLQYLFVYIFFALKAGDVKSTIKYWEYIDF